jgi:hypothetical protein
MGNSGNTIHDTGIVEYGKRQVRIVVFQCPTGHAGRQSIRIIF